MTCILAVVKTTAERELINEVMWDDVELAVKHLKLSKPPALRILAQSK